MTHEAEQDDKTLFGFWVYLMTDCLLFGTLFATFMVLRNNTNGGEGGSELFSLPFVLAETLILLTSSFTAGLAILAARKKEQMKTLVLLGITFLLGAAFLVLEVSEFRTLASEGNDWQRSAFLSSFFTLVGTHGLHIASGLLWMGVVMTQIARSGLHRGNLRRLALLALFWHFLDIIWIFIFTIVYLLGVL